ncbi:Retrovirus-related Pol polyprotein from transposon RE1 [Senna tora]|uniref:Retrovirus-related Pol polyprotein from transposon RE1 n=1 Tax=Senna tora TaxID=362788 RepID=A0A834WRR2_9FABA|nr:Retrovirus-related Pol polyprotein from transposon RE1 [Senna tora]
MSSKTISPSLPQTEPELSIQSFHQCSSFISIKLSTNNLLLWRNQITPLVRSLGVLHHLTSGEKPTEEIKGDAEKSSPNPNYQKWVTNDGLLTSWLLGTMKEEVLTMINGDTAYEIWTSIEEQLLPATVEKARWLKNMFMTIKKGSRSLEEYLREFKSICDNLAAIKESVSDQDKVFQFAHGLGPRYESFRVAMLTKTLRNMKTAPHMEINQDMKIAPHMEINQGADMKAKVNHNVDLKTAEYKEMNSTNLGKYKGSTTNAI